MLNKIKSILSDKIIRKRILFVLAILIVFRALSTIPVPGVNVDAIRVLVDGNSFFQVINLFSGGGLSALSILMLGAGPYITASIIIQLLTMVFPKMKELQQEEGAAGRKKLSQYSRLLTVPIAFIQTFAIVTLITRQSPEVFGGLTSFAFVQVSIIVVASSLLLMWIGERLTEYGIGNGISMIITIGIIAAIPQTLSRIWSTYDSSQLFTFIIIAVLAVIVMALIVYITEAERPIEVNYARQARSLATQGASGSHKTYLPIKLNQAGVMPIIFAITILIFPSFLGNIMSVSSNEMLQNIGRFINIWSQNPWVYGIIYFALVFFFTYFYTAVTFDPKQMSENLQKQGAFVSGIRPGDSTMDYLSRIVTRTTFIGATFLACIAVLPNIVQGFTGIATISVGGTGLLIVISTLIDVIKKINAQLSMREY
jgi:preprotein translocase subunit SecY